MHRSTTIRIGPTVVNPPTLRPPLPSARRARVTARANGFDRPGYVETPLWEKMESGAVTQGRARLSAPAPRVAADLTVSGWRLGRVPDRLRE